MKADAEAYLVDFSLGLIPLIEATRVEVRDVRFGIVPSEPTRVFTEGATLAMDRQPVGTGTVVLTTPDNLKQLRLDTGIYVPPMDRWQIPRQQFKVRFTAPFVDFLFQPFQGSKAHLRYELPLPSETYSLSELIPVSELILFLHEATLLDSRIDLEANVDSKPMFIGNVDVTGALGKLVVDYANAIVRAGAICKHFDVHQTVTLKPAELLQQEVRLIAIASVLSPVRPAFTILFWTSESPPDGVTCLPYATEVVVGQYRMAVSLAILGKPEATGESGEKGKEFRIQTSDATLCRQYLCGRDEVPKYTLADLAQHVVQDYQESTNILIAPGVNSHLLTP